MSQKLTSTEVRNAIKKSIRKDQMPAKIRSKIVALADAIEKKRKPMKFDSKLLADNILSKRTRENISFRDVQLSHGIGKAQLWALEIGKAKPSIDTLVAVLSWLGHDANKYFHS